MNYEEALAYLSSLESLGIKLALRNITQVLEALGHPEKRCPSVLVSGTNGKGSVAALVASALTAAGHRTALYTSPHLVRYEERIRVDGAPISPEAFGAALGRVRRGIDALLAEGRLKAHPTHFETLTAAAFLYFAESGVEVSVLEVGMGGRLDATVLAGPILSVITNVSLEHTSFLGDTVEAIAFEKAGILPRGGTLLTAETGSGPRRVFAERAAAESARLVELDAYAKVEELPASRFTLTTPRRRYERLEHKLPGTYQRRNAALAVAACDLLDELGIAVPAEAVREGLLSARWPGRFQVVAQSPRLVLDGAHNPAGCAALAGALEAAGCDPAATTLVFGVLRQKEHEPMLAALRPAAGKLILTRGAHEKFRDPFTYLAAARRAGFPEITPTGTLEEALARARRVTPVEGTICLCGSLYLVGDAMRLLEHDPISTPQPA